MYQSRRPDYIELEERLESKVLVYVTSDRPGWETQVAADTLDYLIDHLDKWGQVPKISLYLHTRGGDTLSAWSIVNLIRQFCDELQIIVPVKAHSAGTLMCLGATSIMMTKQATLGPIDPSLNTPLNPQIPGGNPLAKAPVSVEAIKGFFELAKTELNINDEKSLSDLLIKLADLVHPLVLGQVYRSKSQIQMLAKKLLAHQPVDPDKIDAIISFLVSDSGSHDYTIYRKEARDQLGLNIIKPTVEQYDVIKRIYNDISGELEFNKQFDPEGLLGQTARIQYGNKRALIESVEGGSHFMVSEGELTRVMPQLPPGIPPGQIPPGFQPQIQDQRKFDGWRYENAPVPDPQQHRV